MRRSVCLLVALALGAPVTVAQPAAADSALVERLIDGFRLDVVAEQMDALADSTEAMAGAEAYALAGGMADAMLRMDWDAIGDSIRAAVYRDYRPGLVREAVVFFEDPRMDRMMDAAPFTTGGIGPQQMAMLLENPGDRPLADSALADRYARAVLAATQPPDLMREMSRQMIDAFPASVRSAMADAGLLDMVVESAVGDDARAAQLDVMIRASRIGLADADPADVEATAAFYESEAGRYVSRRMMVGMMGVQVPRLIEGMRPMFEMMERTVKDLPEGGAGPPPPPPPPARGSVEVYEVAEVQPEMVGGIEGLMRRVEYPEAARREGVEGQVIVQFVVDERGKVIDPVVMNRADDRLADAALAAVRASVFKPGSVRGRPVRVRFAVPVTFRLRDDAPEDTDG